MNAIAKFFIDNNKFTLVLTLFVFVFGIGGLLRLNAESFPAVDFAVATVTTVYDGASPEDIETQITKPLEDEIRTVSGLKDVKSTSQAGVSKIVIRADIDNIDVTETMSDLQRSIDRVSDLPADLKDKPVFTEIKSEEFPVIEIALIGSNENRQRDLIADQLKEDLEDNKSVLSVRTDGFLKRNFRIFLDVEKLQRYHIGVDEVLDKITLRNVNVPGGHLKTQQTQQLLRIEGKVEDVGELQNLVLRSNFSGRKVLLKDVARVEDSKEEARVLARYNGDEATLLIVTKKGGTDTIALVDAIDEKLKLFEEKYGEKYQFVVYNNESLRVKNRLEVLGSNAISGLVLVIFFLLIFLPGRIGFMASLSLPIAVLATMGFMPAFGMNLNAVTILALVIALGMLVDNSVVISENFSRLRSDGLPALKAAQSSIRQLWLPITATALTTIAAFLPMLVTTGIMGQFIKFIPIIVTISLVMSLGESFFLLPMRLTTGKTKHIKSSQSTDWFQKRFVEKFTNMMRVLVRKRYWALGGFSAILFLAMFMMVVGNKFILFPPDQTEIYLGRIELPKGTRLDVTNEKIGVLSKQVKEVAGEHMLHVIARAGNSQTDPSDPKAKEGNNVGILLMYVDDYAKDNITHTEMLKRLRSIPTDGFKNLSWEAQINGPPVGEPVNGTLRSNNMDNLTAMSEQLIKKLEDTPGIYDVRVDDVIGDDEVYVKVDYVKADRLGLNIRNIGDTIRAAISGKNVTNVNLNNKEVDIVVQLKEKSRTNVKDLMSLKIMDRQGNLIPLGSFASFEVRSGSPQIKRFDFKRSKTITALIEEDKITAIKANALLEKYYNELFKQYKDVSLVFGGEGEQTKESMDSLWNALVLSLIGIFALLVFVFNSFLRPFIIMTTIPLGLVGFSVAFALHQRPISFLALIGIIGLGGIIVNSGIILISFIDEMRAEGKYPFEEVLARASGIRLRAVVVSSLTTISGLLPTAYGIGGSDAILIPMTLAMAWGLTSGTILTLIWVPCAYAITEDFTNLVNRLLRKNPEELGDTSPPRPPQRAMEVSQ